MTTATRTRPAELTLAHFAAQVPAMAGGNSPWASRYARELREVAVRAQHRSPRSTQRELGPSEIGHICHRLVVGKMAGQPITNHVVDPWPSIVGTAVHAWLATAFERENEINGVIRWLTERRVAADPRYPGTADLYDGYELALVDHKVLGPTTMARVQSAAGPAWHYIVQMLIYAAGYRVSGYRVDRVVLAAWPRTESTLDSMYCWELPHVPARDDEILRQVFAITAQRRQVANAVLAGQIRIEQVPRTPGEECYFCFAGETEVVTRDGIKPIRDLAGTEPSLLVPVMSRNHGQQSRGQFTTAPVREFGKQQLWKITLGSRRAEKIVYATADHRWIPEPRLSRAKEPEVTWPETTTRELQPGDRLWSLRAINNVTEMMPWAIAQGFAYGDGTRGQGDRPASLSIYDNGKDEAMLPFYPFREPAQHADKLHISGLPRFWKDLPPIRESRTFLLSWLAGYFAADGTVAENGQATLCSADEQSIRFARDVAAVCGIGYGPIRSGMRLGYGSEESCLWSVDLRKRDVPSWFFLIKEHAIRAAASLEAPARGTYWTVKSVQVTDRFETVYCATVPDAGMFGLADDLLTGNCPFYRPQSALDGGPGCPGQSERQ